MKPETPAGYFRVPDDYQGRVWIESQIKELDAAWQAHADDLVKAERAACCALKPAAQQVFAGSTDAHDAIEYFAALIAARDEVTLSEQRTIEVKAYRDPDGKPTCCRRWPDDTCQFMTTRSMGTIEVCIVTGQDLERISDSFLIPSPGCPVWNQP